MRYSEAVVPATFISRPNRFIAKVSVNGEERTVHVKNTGRCKELLVPGCKVYLALSENNARKTSADLVAVDKQTDDGRIVMINIDSQAPNAVVYEWLCSGALFSMEAHVQREVTHGDSRFDFYVEDGERKAFIEVKGVTLEEKGVAMFPDAPTERGVKHLRGLVSALDEGFEAYIIFVIQLKGVDHFTPNRKTHPEFHDVLKLAHERGVRLIAMDCDVTSETLTISSKIKIML